MANVGRFHDLSGSTRVWLRTQLHRDRTAPHRYGAAVAATALAMAGALAIDLPLHVDTNFLLIAAVAISAWYGGRGPGLLASILSVAAIDVFFVVTEPARPGLGQMMYLGAFLLVSVVVSTTTEALRRARARAEAHAEKLQEFTVELEQQMEEVQTLSENLQESNDSLSAALAAAERMASRATRLQKVTAALSQARTLDEVADVVLDAGLDVVEAARGILGLVDEARLEIVRASGYALEVESDVRLLPLEQNAPYTLAVTSGEPVWVRSGGEYRRRFPWAYERFGAVSATEAIAAVPLRNGGEIIGVLGLSFSAATALGAADRAFTLLLAEATAGAVARAQSFDAERVARREAEMLAQARSDVLGIVAHDLRNPLNLIGSSGQLMLELDLAESQRRQMLELGQRAVRQMNRLIGDLLDATRLQAGQLTLDLGDVEAREILQEVMETFRHAAEERRVRLEMHPPPHPCRMRADAGRIIQALGNLMGNALKFTNGGGHITLSAERTGEEIVYRVADDGPGIPAEHQAHLFERFWQARNGDRRGVGLGLAIVKGIVDAHGGRIRVDSAMNAGSTFSIALPVRQEAVTPAAVHAT